jgi:hypothetical protein
MLANPSRPVQVLPDGQWVGGWLEAYRRDESRRAGHGALQHYTWRAVPAVAQRSGSAKKAASEALTGRGGSGSSSHNHGPRCCTAVPFSRRRVQARGLSRSLGKRYDTSAHGDTRQPRPPNPALPAFHLLHLMRARQVGASTPSRQRLLGVFGACFTRVRCLQLPGASPTRASASNVSTAGSGKVTNAAAQASSNLPRPRPRATRFGNASTKRLLVSFRTVHFFSSRRVGLQGVRVDTGRGNGAR